MTIKSVRAVSYRAIQRWKEEPHDSPITSWGLWFDNVWLIHITDVDMPSLFHDSEKCITLKFEDIDPNWFAKKKGYMENDDQAILSGVFSGERIFSQADAKKVLDFLHRANANPDSNDALLVNCMAGVSRSGAVVDFARVMFGIGFDEFKRLNPRIVPNRHVKQLLFAAWHEEPEMTKEESTNNEDSSLEEDSSVVFEDEEE